MNADLEIFVLSSVRCVTFRCGYEGQVRFYFFMHDVWGVGRMHINEGRRGGRVVVMCEVRRCVNS